VIHGSTDKETTWCGKDVLSREPGPNTQPGPPVMLLLSWTANHWEVTCVPCLHGALNQSCKKCKDRKRADKEAR
jgi:hypothetical protein